MPSQLTAHATLSSKGQLVIPKALRDALGLHEGTEVVLRTEVDGSLHLTPLKQPVDRLFGMLQDGGRGTVDIEEAILDAVREKHR